MTQTALLPREQLRTFHLSGHHPDDVNPGGALRPIALFATAPLPDLEASYPMCVHPDGTAQPLRSLIHELEHAENITAAFRAAMNRDSCVPLQAVAGAAIESLVECSATEIARLRKLLPPALVHQLIK